MKWESIYKTSPSRQQERHYHVTCKLEGVPFLFLKLPAIGVTMFRTYLGPDSS